MVPNYFEIGIMIDHGYMPNGDMNKGDNNADAELLVFIFPLFLGCFKQMCIPSKANQQERDGLTVSCKYILENNGLTIIILKKHSNSRSLTHKSSITEFPEVLGTLYIPTKFPAHATPGRVCETYRFFYV